MTNKIWQSSVQIISARDPSFRLFSVHKTAEMFRDGCMHDAASLNKEWSLDFSTVAYTFV